MPICQLCSSSFPIRQNVNGKIRNFQRRKYCLTCSPFGSGNRKKLNNGVNDSLRKRKRHASWIKQQRKARKERKALLINMLGNKCQRCGYDKCTSALSFHHKDPTNKLFTVGSNNLLIKWEKVLKEVDKCELLCLNCHAEYHDSLRTTLT